MHDAERQQATDAGEHCQASMRQPPEVKRMRESECPVGTTLCVRSHPSACTDAIVEA